MEVLKDLELLIKSRYPIIAVETFEEERLEEVLQQVASRCALPLFVWTITGGLRRIGADKLTHEPQQSSSIGDWDAAYRAPTVNPVYDTQHPVKALRNVDALDTEGIYLFKDLHRYLEEAEVVRKLQDLARPSGKAHINIVLSAPHIELPPELEKLAAFFKLDLPTAQELRLLARRVVRDLSKVHRIKVVLSAEEFSRLIDGMKGFTLLEAERVLTKAVLDDMALTGKDVDSIVEIKKELLGKEGVLEYHRPDEGMVQIGGLENLKKWLQKRQKAFTPEATQFGIQPPKGILILGVQGCGKSMAARAVAKAWNLPLLQMEAGRLYDKYVGESEKKLERALNMAERMAPCVLMIDEIEKGFANVGSSEADAGLSRRIFGRLLGWLQDRKEPIFIVATCNDLSKLPPELTRKGRFDEIFFIDLPNREERQEIFTVHLKKRKRDPSTFDLNRLAQTSDGFSGAEIEQAIVSALYTAFSRGTDLNTALLLEELQATKPLSVTREEEITALRQWAQGRTVMASAG